MNLYEIYAPTLEQAMTDAPQALNQYQINKITVTVKLVQAIKPDVEAAMMDTNDAEAVRDAFLNAAGYIAGQLALICNPPVPGSEALDLHEFFESIGLGMRDRISESLSCASQTEAGRA